MGLEFETRDPSINLLWAGDIIRYNGRGILKFSQRTAIEYAKKNNISYKVIEPKRKEFVIKSYADNFLKLVMWDYFTERKWLLWSWGGFAFIILSLLAQTYIDVKINEWYKVLRSFTGCSKENYQFYDGIAYL